MSFVINNDTVEIFHPDGWQDILSRINSKQTRTDWFKKQSSKYLHF